MTISSLTGLSYGAQLNAQRLGALKSQLDGLSTQLSTGNAAQTYGGLGAARGTALSAQARIATLDGYTGAITTARTRLSLASASVTQVSKIATSVSGALGAATAGQTATGLTTQQLSARGQLAAALDALNQTTGDTYLFSGRATDTQPVLGADAILDGDQAAGLDGLTTLIAERKTADGVSGTGNLATSWAAGSSTVTLSEPSDALTRENFGFVLGSVTSTGSAITQTPTAGTAATTTVALAAAAVPPATDPPTIQDGGIVRVSVNQPDGTQKLVDYVARTTPTPGSTTEFAIGADNTAAVGNLNALLASTNVTAVGVQSSALPVAGLTVTGQGTPDSVGLAVTGTPSDGDKITVNLRLHDGTTTSVTLTAKATPDPGDPTQFAIGATTDATAGNLSAALKANLGTAAGTTLASSAATLAAKDMFAGSTTPGESPRRIVATSAPGTTPATYAFSANPTGKTVVWYKGDDASTDARATASAQVGDGYDVAYGARADEPAFQSALAGLAALASESYGTSGTVGANDAARYNALSSRVTQLLVPSDGSQTLTQVGTELSLADASMANAQTRNTATKAVLQNTVSGIEDADTNTVATALVALQTQLQASYQVTSMLSKLSLVNYL